MSKHIDQLDLGKIVAQHTGEASNVVDSFIEELFYEIEKGLVTDSSIKVEGLGFFRIIKSGSSNKILFIGDRVSDKTTKQQSRIDSLPSEYPDKKESAPIQEPDRSEHSPNELRDTELNIEDRLENTSNEEFLDSEDSRNSNDPVFNKPRGQSYAEYSAQFAKKDNKKSKLIKTTVIVLVILIAGVIAYLLVFNSAQANNKININEEGSFVELSNHDSLLYNCVIESKTDVSLQHLAKYYYGNEIFWPYIYYENKSNVEGIYTILAGTTIKVPRVTVDLADVYSGKAVATAKDMAQKIRKANL